MAGASTAEPERTEHPRREGDAEAVIATRALTKRYRGGQLAVDGLDLTVPAGSVFGFLGPNGSGKTTTIRMLMGLIEPTSGTAAVLGRPVPRDTRAVLPQVGALIEDRPCTASSPAGTTCCATTRPTRPPTRAPGASGSGPRWTGWAWRPPPARRRGRTRSA